MNDDFLDEYLVWDSAISFQMDKWNIRLNIANVFNDRYYQKALFLGGLSAEYRNAELTIRYIF